jgi:hypothetical protein
MSRDLRLLVGAVFLSAADGGQRVRANWPSSPSSRRWLAPAARPARGRHASNQRPLDGVRLRGDRVLRVTITAAVGALLFMAAALTVEIFWVKDVVSVDDTA